jgi:hypothetical protein
MDKIISISNQTGNFILTKQTVGISLQKQSNMVVVYSHGVLWVKTNSLKRNSDLYSVKFKLTKVVARDSRKIFRLFKSLNEFETIRQKIEKDLVWQPNKAPVILEILSRLGFFFYWIFDNIQILASIKFLNADPSFHLKLASYGWFFGVLFSILKQISDLLALLKKKKDLEKSDNIDFLILKTLTEISGKFGDLLVAANGAGLVQPFNSGKSLSDGVLGFAGLYSSIIALSSLYLK